MITLLINSYEVPRSLVLPSRITKTKSIRAWPFLSTSFSLLMMFLACRLSASFPSPRPGLSHRIKFFKVYFSMSIVSGSTPIPTLATSASNRALIVELLPQPVAPVIMIFTSCSRRWRMFFSILFLSCSAREEFWISFSKSSKMDSLLIFAMRYTSFLCSH